MRRRASTLLHLSCLVGGLLAGITLPVRSAAQGRAKPPPPASRPVYYDPDPLTCQPAIIRSGFERQLQPYADQSEAVLQQLRRVQLELTAATLRRCVARGLMTPESASALEAELLRPGAGSGAQPPEPSTRP
jgi:hypothetical protein